MKRSSRSNLAIDFSKQNGSNTVTRPLTVFEYVVYSVMCSPGQQICFEISVEHELHNRPHGLIPGADPKKFDNVFVVEPLHHVSLTQKVQLLLTRRSSLQGFNGHSNLTKK